MLHAWFVPHVGDVQPDADIAVTARGPPVLLLSARGAAVGSHVPAASPQLPLLLRAFQVTLAPVGIDIRKVVDESRRPVINTATAHKEPGMGIIGAGVVQAPMKCFVDAVGALAAMAAR